MTIGTKIHSTLETSRLLNSDEIKEFNSIKYVSADEFKIMEMKISPNLLNYGYLNKWLYFKGNLFISNYSEEYFFIETLQYLINHFFKPKGIVINGCVTGYEEIFGSYFCYRVRNNEIIVDTLFEQHLDSLVLDSDIIKNLELVYEYIIKPFDYNHNFI